jgi:hypothetical protein
MFVICDGLYRTLASHSQAAVQFKGDETGQKRPDGRDGTRARRAKWRSQLFGKAGEMSQLHLSLSLCSWRLACACVAWWRAAA